MYNVEYLEKLAYTVRCDALKGIYKAGSGHAGGSFSAAELLTVLYFHVMNIDPKNPQKPDRDRFVLSKGHAGPVYFSVLARRGYFDVAEIEDIRQIHGRLQATPSLKVEGCDMSSGSLGQGLSTGVGMALAGRMDKLDYRVFVMLGDGELQEGQNWEAFMAAAQFKLGNLIVILDNNHVQMCDETNNIMSLGDVEKKLEAFGWNVIKTAGHDVSALINVFDNMQCQSEGKPTVIIAETVKGKGVSFMEGKAKWHGGAPSKEEMKEAMEELGRRAL